PLASTIATTACKLFLRFSALVLNNSSFQKTKSFFFCYITNSFYYEALCPKLNDSFLHLNFQHVFEQHSLLYSRFEEEILAYYPSFIPR
uniref:Uncharacterized protein n=1 Tax=Aegilops tauschii subsp. strangulata TaxID=200361 RepID=A0A453B137_AEGTS